MTNLTDLNSAKPEEGPDGVFRTTLSYGAEASPSYFFGPNEYRAAEALEDSEFVEVFAPMRPEYAPS
jgi:hypothetical protein